MERFVYEVGDIVKLKKPHPCGSQEWEILRVGCLLYTSPSPRDRKPSRMPSSA